MSTDRGFRLGGDDYNHATDGEYKRLRLKADELHQKRQKASLQSQAAYKSGDGAKAKQFSEEAKRYQNEAESYNRQAAEYVLRENNADSAGDEIDLHGLYVKEAEFILQQRLGAAIRSNQNHLRVIVGKGNHSENGIAKLKPAIDAMCDESNLKHYIDKKNTGVLVIDLNGAQASQIPSKWTTQGLLLYQGLQQPQYQQHQQQYQQPYQQQPQQQGGDNGILGLLVKLVCACLK